NYYEVVPSNQLEVGLWLESDRMSHLLELVDHDALANQIDVVRNERRQRYDNAPYNVAKFALQAALYPEGHPYRRGDSPEIVAAITREQACAFAEAHYAPSNAVLVVSGPVTAAEVNEMLEKFVVKAAARDVRARSAVPPTPAKFRRVDAKAPIDDNAILVAWPLPSDPVTQLTVVTAARRVESMIAASDLQTRSFIFGDKAAPMLGVFITLGDEEKRTTNKLLSEIEAAVSETPKSFRVRRPAWLARAALDRMQQNAIYSAFSGLEEGSERDEMIAATVLAGRDPNEMLAAQGSALNKLSAEALERLAETHLRYDQATVAVLTPSDTAKRGTSVKLAAPVHDTGQRREPPDAVDAQRPADAALPPQRAIAGMRKRSLANGLDVVLLPVTSVPTVEIRLVFGSGTADEPDTQRGAARAAAGALKWSNRYAEDFVLFAAGGGTQNVDVGADLTVFTARGVDMHLDLLLTGLRRFVRDGVYDVTDIAAIRKAARGASDEPIADSWRAALFGASHPYAHVYSVSPMLSLEAIEAYRKQHHTPGNATLVIAGRFDAALADKWIDYLFADWTGAAPASSNVHATTQPMSIANDDDEINQIGVSLAIPAGKGSRAEQLVAAAMLDGIVEDIRHQLGASYAFGAALHEARLATTYVVSGWIDAPRTRDAFELVRLRLAALRSDPEAAARTFITARRRVIVHLLRSTSSAYELAERVQRDIELERAPLSDAQTAEAVNQLTIDKMPSVLAEIDLSRAVVVLRGPRETIDDAFAALGRTPKRIAILDEDDPVVTKQVDDDSELSNIEDPSKPSGSRWTLGTFLGYTTATMVDQGVGGYSVGADLGYRFKRSFAAGIHASVARLDGTYESSSLSAPQIEVIASAMRLATFIQASANDDRLWGAAYVGLSSIDVKDNGMVTSSTALGVGAHGGYDVANFAKHHITVYGRLDADIESSTSFAGFTFGVGYRYR
nr:insulinase family protein [Deltaproteobacteria bacterium]